MKINKPSRAGSMESNDILIILYPSEKREINLTSIVKKQFGEQIEKIICETLDEIGVEGVKVDAEDKGALDYCIKARVITAVERGQE